MAERTTVWRTLALLLAGVLLGCLLRAPRASATTCLAPEGGTYELKRMEVTVPPQEEGAHQFWPQQARLSRHDGSITFWSGLPGYPIVEVDFKRSVNLDP